MNQSSLYAYLKKYKTDFNLRFDNGLVIVSEDNQGALKACDVARFFGFDTFVLPDFRAVFGEDLRSYQEELSEIFATLREFYACKGKKILFSPLSTLLHSLPNEESLRGISLQIGSTLRLQDFKETLFYLGYEFVDLVELGGEVSIRGDIVDIFGLQPHRITLFGDEVESIRAFDIQSQLCSKEDLDTLTIPPAFLNLNAQTYAILHKIISENQTTLLDEISKNNSLVSFGFWYLNEINAAQDFLQTYPFVLLPDVKELAKEILGFKEQDEQSLQRILKGTEINKSEEYQDFEFNFNTLNNFLEFHKNKQITIIAKTESQVRQAAISLSNTRFTFVLDTDVSLNILGKEEVILSLNSSAKRKKRIKTKIFLDELNAGDYVVHCDYGIAIFNGIVQTNIFGAIRD
ncbi:CarD family transcriptional regulator, partial [Helicobacter rodentium]